MLVFLSFLNATVKTIGPWRHSATLKPTEAPGSSNSPLKLCRTYFHPAQQQYRGERSLTAGRTEQASPEIDKHYTWTSVFVPNRNWPDSLRLILRRALAPISQDGSSPGSEPVSGSD
ncbi:uncharacterized protein LOC144461783 [Epinephelus lanceolatus]